VTAYLQQQFFVLFIKSRTCARYLCISVLGAACSDSKKLTRNDILSLRTEELTEVLEMKADDVQRMKLVSLGLRFATPDKKSESRVSRQRRKRA